MLFLCMCSAIARPEPETLNTQHTTPEPETLDAMSVAEFDAELARVPWRHTLVEFHAPWCEACTSFAPELAAVRKQLVQQNVHMIRVNGDSVPDLRALSLIHI